MGWIEILIVVAIIAIIVILLMAATAGARSKAIGQLRAQLAGTWAAAPPNPVTSATSTVNYTLALGPTSIALTPNSAFHKYLSVQATFTLTGNGGAVFADGSRSFSIPMSQTGQAVIGIRAVANGSDHLKVSYTVTETGTPNAVVISEPVEHDFETRFP